MRGLNICLKISAPKPDIDEMIFGSTETIPSER